MKKKIALYVLSAHFFIFVCLSFQHWITSSPKKITKIAVNTIRLAPPPAPIAVAPVKKNPSPATPKKTTAPAKKNKQLINNLAALTSPSSPKTEILIPTLPATPKPEILIPVLPTTPPPEVTTSFEPSPAEKISLFLQETLQLPDFGEVKIQISIDRLGRLQKLEILESKNEKNAEFLKNRLPDLQFPCLNEVSSLTIVFSNAI